jgi:Tfp pilus assembly protein PilF
VEATSIYCQNCRAANSLNETYCQNCGTRLLLVIFPNSLQYDTNNVPSFYEDHLLERVSLLELRLAQLTEGLQAAMEVIREQGKIVKEEHALVKSLHKTLGHLNTEETEKLKTDWQNSTRKGRESRSRRDKISQVVETIAAEHVSPNTELFTRLLNEGIRLLAKNEEKQGFQMLERAAALSPKNVPLRRFIAESLFRADKFAEAGKHLEKALQTAPEDPKMLLLLGAINADVGDIEKARRLLSLPAENEKTAPVVNFIWGMLSAFEDKWMESLAAFKIADQNEEIPEMQYLVGCVYFQIGRETAALRHLQKAVLLDPGYSDAWFMQSVIYELQTNAEGMSLAFEKAMAANESGAQSLEFLKGKKQPKFEIALPFRHFKQKNARILNSGSQRLRRFFKNEIGRAAAEE